MSVMYEQGAVAVADPETFGAVKTAVEQAFAAAQVSDFLRSVERAHLRVREFEAVLTRGLLGSSAAEQYARLAASDQGQIRELYLANLEHVPAAARDRFFKLYAYY